MTEINSTPTITKEIINDKLHVRFNNGPALELKTVETCLNNPNQCFCDINQEMEVRDQNVQSPFKTVLPNVAIVGTVDVTYHMPRKTVIDDSMIKSVGGPINVIEEAFIEPNTVTFPRDSGLYASCYHLYNSQLKRYNSVNTELYNKYSLSNEIDASLERNALIGRRYAADIFWRRSNEEVIKEDTYECLEKILKRRDVAKLV
jgi:hypothetical protein